MTDIRKIPLPRTPDGAVTWANLAPYLELVHREMLAKFDARNPNSDFADAFLASSDGTATIGDAASISTQRTLPVVNAGNRASAQTSNPLTSIGTASTASIIIASHTIQYGGFTVSYNGGTISGLNPLTTYYVYADDEYSGGAVAYSATTNFPTVVAARNRYYVGQITTANSSPSGNITNITQANPGVVTQVGHPFSTGNQIIITGVSGMTEVNGNVYSIIKLTADTYSIVDTTTFTAYVSGGTATRVSSPSSGGGGGGSGYAIP